MKAKGGVTRDRPLRKGPSQSVHLKLLWYKVMGAARSRHSRAIMNPDSGRRTR